MRATNIIGEKMKKIFVGLFMLHSLSLFAQDLSGKCESFVNKTIDQGYACTNSTITDCETNFTNFCVNNFNNNLPSHLLLERNANSLINQAINSLGFLCYEEWEAYKELGFGTPDSRRPKRQADLSNCSNNVKSLYLEVMGK